LSEIYIESDIKLKWKCLKVDCKEIFEMNWNHVLQGRGCSYCAGRKISLSNCLATKNSELAKEWHPTKNGDLTPYDVTCGDNQKVWWICDKGHEWRVAIANRLNTNCPYCSGRYASKENNLLVLNPELCKDWDYNKNNKQPEEYCLNGGQKVYWKCSECGWEWKASINNRSNGRGCPQCNESKGEKRINKWLVNINNLFYISQKEFEGLLGLGNGSLSYDFYLPNHNLLIEYQGRQHEKYIPGFHKSKKDFEKQLEHDRRKREYAKNNKIELLEIWYWDFDKIEEILSKSIRR